MLPLSNQMDNMILSFVLFSNKMVVTTLGLCARHLLNILGSIIYIIWPREGVGATLSFYGSRTLNFKNPRSKHGLS